MSVFCSAEVARLGLKVWTFWSVETIKPTLWMSERDLQFVHPKPVLDQVILPLGVVSEKPSIIQPLPAKGKEHGNRQLTIQRDEYHRRSR